MSLAMVLFFCVRQGYPNLASQQVPAKVEVIGHGYECPAVGRTTREEQIVLKIVYRRWECDFRNKTAIVA